MSSDPCDRARRALGELCGDGPVEGGPVGDDSDTFYVQTVHTQGRAVQASDTNEVAEAAEDAASEAEITLAVSPQESVETQTISPSRNRMETYFKLPVKKMSPRQVESVMDSIENMMSESRVTRGRGFDSIRLVDRAVVFDAVPEMVGPAREDQQFV